MKYTRLTKTSAILLIFCFFLSELAYAAPQDGRILSPASAPLDLLARDPETFQAPVNFSNLKEIHKGTADTLIIHIQDAHSNLSGQQNLAGSLDEIMNQYGVSLVLAEGGSPADGSLALLKKIASPEITARTAKSLLVDGRIAGEEYLNLVSDHPMKIRGVEDMSLYRKSVESYGALADKRQAALDYLKTLQSALDKLKNKFYPKELLDYEGREQGEMIGDASRLISLIEKNRTDLTGLPNILKIQMLQTREKTIDFNLANLEQAALLERLGEAGAGEKIKGFLERFNQSRNSKASQYALFQSIFNIAKEKNLSFLPYPNLQKYGEYLKEFQEIDLDQLLDEMQKAEDRAYASSLRSAQVSPDQISDALMIRAIDRYIGLLKTAYNIRMSSSDFKFFEANEPDFATAGCLAFMNRKLAEQGYFQDLIAYKGDLDEGKKALEAFYDSVDQRDMAFIENMRRILKEEKQKVAVLITGGYHSSHLNKLFKQSGYSFAVLAPIVTSETNQRKYEDLLLASTGRETKKTPGGSAAEKNHFKSGADDVRILRAASSGPEWISKYIGLAGVSAANKDVRRVRSDFAGRIWETEGKPFRRRTENRIFSAPAARMAAAPSESDKLFARMGKILTESGFDLRPIHVIELQWMAQYLLDASLVRQFFTRERVNATDEQCERLAAAIKSMTADFSGKGVLPIDRVNTAKSLLMGTAARLRLKIRSMQTALKLSEIEISEMETILAGISNPAAPAISFTDAPNDVMEADIRNKGLIANPTAVLSMSPLELDAMIVHELMHLLPTQKVYIDEVDQLSKILTAHYAAGTQNSELFKQQAKRMTALIITAEYLTSRTEILFYAASGVKDLKGYYLYLASQNRYTGMQKKYLSFSKIVAGNIISDEKGLLLDRWESGTIPSALRNIMKGYYTAEKGSTDLSFGDWIYSILLKESPAAVSFAAGQVPAAKNESQGSRLASARGDITEFTDAKLASQIANTEKRLVRDTAALTRQIQTFNRNKGSRIVSNAENLLQTKLLPGLDLLDKALDVTWAWRGKNWGIAVQKGFERLRKRAAALRTTENKLRFLRLEQARRVVSRKPVQQNLFKDLKDGARMATADKSPFMAYMYLMLADATLVETVIRDQKERTRFMRQIEERAEGSATWSDLVELGILREKIKTTDERRAALIDEIRTAAMAHTFVTYTPEGGGRYEMRTTEYFDRGEQRLLYPVIEAFVASRKSPVRIEDVGISTGAKSLQLARFLDSKSLASKVVFTGSDYLTQPSLVKLGTDVTGAEGLFNSSGELLWVRLWSSREKRFISYRASDLKNTLPVILDLKLEYNNGKKVTMPRYSESHLEEIRKIFQSAGFVEEDVTKTVPARTADLVLVNNVYIHLNESDRRAALLNIFNHLDSDGGLAVFMESGRRIRMGGIERGVALYEVYERKGNVVRRISTHYRSDELADLISKDMLLPVHRSRWAARANLVGRDAVLDAELDELLPRGWNLPGRDIAPEVITLDKPNIRQKAEEESKIYKRAAQATEMTSEVIGRDGNREWTQSWIRIIDGWIETQRHSPAAVPWSEEYSALIQNRLEALKRHMDDLNRIAVTVPADEPALFMALNRNGREVTADELGVILKMFTGYLLIPDAGSIALQMRFAGMQPLSDPQLDLLSAYLTARVNAARLANRVSTLDSSVAENQNYIPTIISFVSQFLKIAEFDRDDRTGSVIYHLHVTDSNDGGPSSLMARIKGMSIIEAGIFLTKRASRSLYFDVFKNEHSLMNTETRAVLEDSPGFYGTDPERPVLFDLTDSDQIAAVYLPVEGNTFVKLEIVRGAGADERIVDSQTALLSPLLNADGTPMHPFRARSTVVSGVQLGPRQEGARLAQADAQAEAFLNNPANSYVRKIYAEYKEREIPGIDNWAFRLGDTSSVGTIGQLHEVIGELLSAKRIEEEYPDAELIGMGLGIGAHEADIVFEVKGKNPYLLVIESKYENTPHFRSTFERTTNKQMKPMAEKLIMVEDLLGLPVRYAVMGAGPNIVIMDSGKDFDTIERAGTTDVNFAYEAERRPGKTIGRTIPVDCILMRLDLNRLPAADVPEVRLYHTTSYRTDFFRTVGGHFKPSFSARRLLPPQILPVVLSEQFKQEIATEREWMLIEPYIARLLKSVRQPGAIKGLTDEDVNDFERGVRFFLTEGMRRGRGFHDLRKLIGEKISAKGGMKNIWEPFKKAGARSRPGEGARLAQQQIVSPVGPEDIFSSEGYYYLHQKDRNDPLYDALRNVSVYDVTGRRLGTLSRVLYQGIKSMVPNGWKILLIRGTGYGDEYTHWGALKKRAEAFEGGLVHEGTDFVLMMNPQTNEIKTLPIGTQVGSFLPGTDEKKFKDNMQWTTIVRNPVHVEIGDKTYDLINIYTHLGQDGTIQPSTAKFSLTAPHLHFGIALKDKNAPYSDNYPDLNRLAVSRQILHLDILNLLEPHDALDLFVDDRSRVNLGVDSLLLLAKSNQSLEAILPVAHDLPGTQISAPTEKSGIHQPETFEEILNRGLGSRQLVVTTENGSDWNLLKEGKLAGVGKGLKALRDEIERTVTQTRKMRGESGARLAENEKEIAQRLRGLLIYSPQLGKQLMTKVLANAGRPLLQIMRKTGYTKQELIEAEQDPVKYEARIKSVARELTPDFKPNPKPAVSVLTAAPAAAPAANLMSGLLNPTLESVIGVHPFAVRVTGGISNQPIYDGSGMAPSFGLMSLGAISIFRQSNFEYVLFLRDLSREAKISIRALMSYLSLFRGVPAAVISTAFRQVLVNKVQNDRLNYFVEGLLQIRAAYEASGALSYSDVLAAAMNHFKGTSGKYEALVGYVNHVLSNTGKNPRIANSPDGPIGSAEDIKSVEFFMMKEGLITEVFQVEVTLKNRPAGKDKVHFVINVAKDKTLAAESVRRAYRFLGQHYAKDPRFVMEVFGLGESSGVPVLAGEWIENSDELHVYGQTGPLMHAWRNQSESQRAPLAPADSDKVWEQILFAETRYTVFKGDKTEHFSGNINRGDYVVYHDADGPHAVLIWSDGINFYTGAKAEDGFPEELALAPIIFRGEIDHGSDIEAPIYFDKPQIAIQAIRDALLAEGGDREAVLSRFRSLLQNAEDYLSQVLTDPQAASHKQPLQRAIAAIHAALQLKSFSGARLAADEQVLVSKTIPFTSSRHGFLVMRRQEDVRKAVQELQLKWGKTIHSAEPDPILFEKLKNTEFNDPDLGNLKIGMGGDASLLDNQPLDFFLRELLLNAFDSYARAGNSAGDIELRVTRVGGEIRIEISDSGIGLEKIVDQPGEFKVAANPAVKKDALVTGGAGAGLLWAKIAAQSRRGNLTVLSPGIDNFKTTVRMTFPDDEIDLGRIAGARLALEDGVLNGLRSSVISRFESIGVKFENPAEATLEDWKGLDAFLNRTPQEFLAGNLKNVRIKFVYALSHWDPDTRVIAIQSASGSVQLVPVFEEFYHAIFNARMTLEDWRALIQSGSFRFVDDNGREKTAASLTLDDILNASEWNWERHFKAGGKDMWLNICTHVSLDRVPLPIAGRKGFVTSLLDFINPADPDIRGLLFALYIGEYSKLHATDRLYLEHAYTKPSEYLALSALAANGIGNFEDLVPYLDLSLAQGLIDKISAAPGSSAARLAAVSPSLAAAVDLDRPMEESIGKLVDQALAAQEAGADRFHFVVIDAINTAIVSAPSARTNTAVFSAETLRNLRENGVRIPIDVHLEVMNPSNLFINRYTQAGASSVQIHWEAFEDTQQGYQSRENQMVNRLQNLHSQKITAGIVLTPKSEAAGSGDIEGLLHFIENHSDLVDQVVIQGVPPGAIGQTFNEQALDFIRRLREAGFQKEIQVDGGVTAANAALIREAGATVLVAGSAFFGPLDKPQSSGGMTASLTVLSGQEHAAVQKKAAAAPVQTAQESVRTLSLVQIAGQEFEDAEKLASDAAQLAPYDGDKAAQAKEYVTRAYANLFWIGFNADLAQSPGIAAVDDTLPDAYRPSEFEIAAVSQIDKLISDLARIDSEISLAIEAASVTAVPTSVEAVPQEPAVLTETLPVPAAEPVVQDRRAELIAQRKKLEDRIQRNYSQSGPNAKKYSFEMIGISKLSFAELAIVSQYEFDGFLEQVDSAKNGWNTKKRELIKKALRDIRTSIPKKQARDLEKYKEILRQISEFGRGARLAADTAELRLQTIYGNKPLPEVTAKKGEQVEPIRDLIALIAAATRKNTPQGIVPVQVFSKTFAGLEILPEANEVTPVVLTDPKMPGEVFDTIYITHEEMGGALARLAAVKSLETKLPELWHQNQPARDAAADYQNKNIQTAQFLRQMVKNLQIDRHVILLMSVEGQDAELLKQEITELKSELEALNKNKGQTSGRLEVSIRLADSAGNEMEGISWQTSGFDQKRADKKVYSGALRQPLIDKVLKTQSAYVPADEAHFNQEKEYYNAIPYKPDMRAAIAAVVDETLAAHMLNILTGQDMTLPGNMMLIREPHNYRSEDGKPVTTDTYRQRQLVVRALARISEELRRDYITLRATGTSA